jgi:hypothetical protein
MFILGIIRHIKIRWLREIVRFFMFRLMVFPINMYCKFFNFWGLMEVGDQVYAVAALTRNLLGVGWVEPSEVLDAVARGKMVIN